VDDGGMVAADGGAPSPDASLGMDGGGAGADAGPGTGSSDGCGCRVTGPGEAPVWTLMLGLCALLVRSRRRR